ncbi:FecR family protein [Flavobacterium sp. 90]|uniref:FecR family protein n=1 Tax=unclassified Flavobacterium TaxID=196869 RepID=UPI000EACC11F|nr:MULTISPECIES: FecR domain-containing protein [unclassified Flavobacterium]RKR08945.1 FecR family protein [Flavobacterium sp. 81]TCK52733.1 FecR family protein [Flavobacterium sp. 90]
MTLKKSERLIVKFITNEASIEEIEILTKWLEDKENQIVFKDFVKVNYLIDYTSNTFDPVLLKKELMDKIKTEKSIFYKSRTRSYFKYAAILMLFLAGVYYYKNLNFSNSKQNIVVPREDVIVLQMDNGEVQVINPSNSQNLTDKFGKVIGKQDKNKLAYSNIFSGSELVYNTLKIPYGKKFEVALSDGTIVHLNSGSSLRYPVRFLKDHGREVYLTGEAFFEVTKDKKHPFTVNAQDLNVEVLGTKFNVNNYREDFSTNVVLVEGKVSLYKDKKTNSNQVYLTPGLKGSSLTGQQKITTEQVDTELYTDWVKGILVFKNASFDNIIKKLEREYNITFINQNRMLGKEVFNARFDNEPIEVVLKYLSDSYAIDYTIEEDKIIIK